MPGIILLLVGNSNCRLARAETGGEGFKPKLKSQKSKAKTGGGDELQRRASVRPVRVAPTAQVLRAPERFLAGLNASDAALASVVPRATRPLARALAGLTGRPPFLLTGRSRTGLRVRYDRQALGPDRLCAAEGARAAWPGDLAVADFGTAVTLNFITGDGVFRGGPILPGPELMLAALARGTGRLPGTGLRFCAAAFPASTRTALRSGVQAAVAGGVLHALDRAERRTGRSWRLVGTGGNARLFARHLPRLTAVDPLLGCRGLYRLYRHNRVT